MAGFAELKEGAGKKIVLSVALLAIAIGVTIYTNRGGGGATSELWLKCDKCGHAEEVAREKKQAMIQERNEMYIEQVAQENPEMAENLRKSMENPMGMGMGMGGARLPAWGTEAAFVCPKCSEDAFYNAIKCPKCDEVFFTVDENGVRTDKCTKCGFSKSEDRKKSQKAERGKARDIKRGKKKR